MKPTKSQGERMTRLKKPCIRCNNPFIPTGKFSKVCDGCIKKKGFFRNKLKDDIKVIKELVANLPND